METIAKGLWSVEHDVSLLGSIILTSRMTVLDLGDGELLLHSPVPIDDACAAHLATLGEVRWIMAPNDFHHLYVDAAASRYSTARIVGGAGVGKKQPSVSIDHALEDGEPAGWEGKLKVTALEGTRLWNEHVLFHCASQTLVCADFVFNIQRIPNRVTGWMLSMIGANKRFTQTRSEKWVFVRDRSAFEGSVQRIMEFDFDRVVMCHGEVVDSGGYARVAEAVSWVHRAPAAMLTA